MLHAWEKYGPEAAAHHFVTQHNKRHRDPDREEISFPRVVKGKIDFLGMVRGRADPMYLRFMDELRELAPDMLPPRDDPLRTLAEMFTELEASDDPQRRGYYLQNLLKRLFDLHGIPMIKAFTRNEGAEQIDGAFSMGDWHYLVECRWREKLADTREVDGFVGQVSRSGKQTMGFFLSINGWSDNVPQLTKQNPEKNVALMNGLDLRFVLGGDVDLHTLLQAKLVKLNVYGESYYGADELLRDRTA